MAYALFIVLLTSFSTHFCSKQVDKTKRKIQHHLIYYEAGKKKSLAFTKVRSSRRKIHTITRPLCPPSIIDDQEQLPSPLGHCVPHQLYSVSLILKRSEHKIFLWWSQSRGFTSK